jgi:hypothetical protein
VLNYHQKPQKNNNLPTRRTLCPSRVLRTEKGGFPKTDANAKIPSSSSQDFDDEGNLQEKGSNGGDTSETGTGHLGGGASVGRDGSLGGVGSRGRAGSGDVGPGAGRGGGHGGGAVVGLEIES